MYPAATVVFAAVPAARIRVMQQDVRCPAALDGKVMVDPSAQIQATSPALTVSNARMGYGKSTVSLGVTTNAPSGGSARVCKTPPKGSATAIIDSLY